MKRAPRNGVGHTYWVQHAAALAVIEPPRSEFVKWVACSVMSISTMVLIGSSMFFFHPHHAAPLRDVASARPALATDGQPANLAPFAAPKSAA
jgi:hypothetical protein